MKLFAFLLLIFIGIVNSIPADYSSDLKSIQLYYYSLSNGKEQGLSQDPEIIGINQSFPLKILIHGYIANRHHSSIAPVKNAYLSTGQANLIIADWESGATHSYDVSRSMVELIARKIGELLKRFLNQYKSIDDQQIHIIGHSLGAHIAGNVGRYFDGRFGRITGLDPAAPLFVKSSPDAIRKSDGKYVDVIHTCGHVLGEIWPRGDIDFYPNSGIVSQPGCRLLDPLTFYSCSHFRAPIFFAESILNPKSFPAEKTSFPEIFSMDINLFKGNTTRSVRELEFMGESVSKSRKGIFYLETNDGPPFGKGIFKE